MTPKSIGLDLIAQTNEEAVDVVFQQLRMAGLPL